MTIPSWQPAPDRNTTRIAVDVTFLRRDLPADLSSAGSCHLPADCMLVRLGTPSVGFYRYLYNSVGHGYCWWLRRVTPDEELAVLLAHPAISLHVLYRDGEPAGFFELDARSGLDVNLSYFGLMPQAVGQGLGAALLARAIAIAASGSSSGRIRVNTCTADHPRALPTYLAAGFQKLRTVREIWDIPMRLGMPIPDRLRV